MSQVSEWLAAESACRSGGTPLVPRSRAVRPVHGGERRRRVADRLGEGVTHFLPSRRVQHHRVRQLSAAGKRAVLVASILQLARLIASQVAGRRLLAAQRRAFSRQACKAGPAAHEPARHAGRELHLGRSKRHHHYVRPGSGRQVPSTWISHASSSPEEPCRSPGREGEVMWDALPRRLGGWSTRVCGVVISSACLVVWLLYVHHISRSRANLTQNDTESTQNPPNLHKTHRIYTLLHKTLWIYTQGPLRIYTRPIGSTQGLLDLH